MNPFPHFDGEPSGSTRRRLVVCTSVFWKLLICRVPHQVTREFANIYRY
jgi:hypothetical protein